MHPTYSTSLQAHISSTSSSYSAVNDYFDVSTLQTPLSSNALGYDNNPAQRVTQQPSALTSMPMTTSSHIADPPGHASTAATIQQQLGFTANSNGMGILPTATCRVDTRCNDATARDDRAILMRQRTPKATAIFGSGTRTEQHPAYAESSPASRVGVAPFHHHLPPILAQSIMAPTRNNAATQIKDMAACPSPRNRMMPIHDRATVIDHADDNDGDRPWTLAEIRGRSPADHLLFSVDPKEQSMYHQTSPLRVADGSSSSSNSSSSRAIIINTQEGAKYPNKRTFREMSADSSSNSSNNRSRSDRLSARIQLPGLQHIVSPHAIREAEREEKEEALGKTEEHPFRAYSSFISMKHMHERMLQGCSYSSSASPPSLSIPADLSVQGDDDDDFAADETEGAEPHTPPVSLSSSSPVTFCSCPQQQQLHGDHPTTTVQHRPTSRLNVASRLAAAEANALDDIGRLKATSAATPPRPRARERLKRPPNAYLLFNRDMRRKLLEVSPKMTVAEISKEIGERWKQLPSEKREHYIREATLIKQDHLKNHPGFIYTRRSKAELAEARRLSKSRRSSSKNGKQQQPANPLPLPSRSAIDQPSIKRRRKSGAPDAPRDPRGRKKKRHRHPSAPKHPMSGFLFFLAAVRPQVAQQFPGSTVGPISKVIAAQWRDMPEEKRVPWLQKAEEDKARYAREMRVYMANLDHPQQQQQDRMPNDATATVYDTEDLDDSTVATVVQMVNHTRADHDLYPPLLASSHHPNAKCHRTTILPAMNEHDK